MYQSECTAESITYHVPFWSVLCSISFAYSNMALWKPRFVFHGCKVCWSALTERPSLRDIYSQRATFSVLTTIFGTCYQANITFFVTNKFVIFSQNDRLASCQAGPLKPVCWPQLRSSDRLEVLALLLLKVVTEDVFLIGKLWKTFQQREIAGNHRIRQTNSDGCLPRFLVLLMLI